MNDTDREHAGDPMKSLQMKKRNSRHPTKSDAVQNRGFPRMLPAGGSLTLETTLVLPLLLCAAAALLAMFSFTAIQGKDLAA